MKKDIDIPGIVNVVNQCLPHRGDVITALQNCRGGQWEGGGYYRFISGRNANRPGAAWQFKENILLTQKEVDLIILDVLQNGSIGGIEFVDFNDEPV